jgi:hypothetical protein
MSTNISNMFDSTFREYNNKIIYQIVNACANIHKFDVDTTMKQLININEISIQPIQCTESVITMPIKKKRGRPKKVKTEIISNSYVTGQEDPILSKLMNAMKKNTSDRIDIPMEDELQPDTPIEVEDEEFETTLFTHDGIEYLKAEDNKLYENSKDNKFIGNWNSDTQTILSS